jgi:hypothetical protein
MLQLSAWEQNPVSSHSRGNRGPLLLVPSPRSFPYMGFCGAFTTAVTHTTLLSTRTLVMHITQKSVAYCYRESPEAMRQVTRLIL